MSVIKRRLQRLEAAQKEVKASPRYLVTAGSVSVIDRTVRVVVPEKQITATA